MNASALVFMLVAWGLIIASSVIGLRSLLKHSK